MKPDPSYTYRRHMAGNYLNRCRNLRQQADERFQKRMAIIQFTILLTLIAIFYLMTTIP